MVHAVTWAVSRKKSKRIFRASGCVGVGQIKINLLPQLKPLHQTVKYKKKLKMQHINLSEASRISEEAVKNYPSENKSTLDFAMSTLSSCRRNCQTYRKKFMALQRQLRLVKMRSVLESTPAQRQKSIEMVTKLMVEKYFFEYICVTC